MIIHVTPQSRLEAVISRTGASHLVSLLTDAGSFQRPTAIATENFLLLTMNDISAPQPGLVAPSRKHVASLIDFAGHWDRRAPIVVNCFAGVSRSPAAAYVIACALLPDRDEDKLAMELRHLSPSATPNRLIIRHGDELLGRDGRMDSAISAIGRGADAFEGETFAFDLS